jgi:alpha-D-ribose 1-methylphosphonate 5-triphosphate synthase subunit PhnI
MAIRRRISAAFKDIPGGQVLGPTYDYTHRLLDFSLADVNRDIGDLPAIPKKSTQEKPFPRVASLLQEEALMEKEPTEDKDEPTGDLTREPLGLPADRDIRLQNLARGDEGFLLSLGYSLQRGFGYTEHPFAGEIRLGEVPLQIVPEELGFPVEIGEITVTESVMFRRFSGSNTTPPLYTTGYGLTFGHCERKAMAMALVDRALRCQEFGEEQDYPAQDEEFVLCHSDNVEASGFVQHLKLPHYVDFQADLVLLRDDRKQFNQNGKKEFTTQSKKAAGATE